MDHVRAFVGIALPPPCQELADRLASGLTLLAGGRLGRVRPGQAHLTLKFLGDVPASGPAGIGAVAEALCGLAFAPFRLQLAGGGFFPGPDRPRVIWAGVQDGADRCRALAAAVDAALVPVGLSPQQKPFTAHLTLARVREPGRGGDWPAALALMRDARWPPVNVDAVTLWRSVLGGATTRYVVLGEFPATAG